MITFFIPYQTAIEQLCVAYKVKQLYAFGSVLTENFTQNSDIDLKISLSDDLEVFEYGQNVLNIWNEFETLFQRPVDLLTEQTIQNPYLKKEIEATQYLIYDRLRQKILS
jgi:uncharacterized protein